MSPEIDQSIPAITVCQPFARLIAIGEKWCENRKWRTDHVGPILIHAGKSRAFMTPGASLEGLDFGVFVAGAWLQTAVHVSACKTPEWAKHNYAGIDQHPHVEGPYCWLLRDVVPFRDRVAYRGQQGLFEVFPSELPEGSDVRAWAEDQRFKKGPY